MFGKPKTAADILKMIEELPEDEFNKLIDGLDDIEEEEKAPEAEEKAEGEAEETAEETAEEAPEGEEAAEAEEASEEIPEPEAEEPEAVEEPVKVENPVDVLAQKVETLEQTVKALADRLAAKEEEKNAFGIEGRGDAEHTDDGKSESEKAREKYWAF